jgi:methylated-DNA-protein-cysteine methyltransferase-like protein
VRQDPTFLFDYLSKLLSALKFLPSNTNPPIPWHRVIGASGTISSRGPGTTGAQRQRDALQAEGVDVTTGRNGEMRVNLNEFGWFPSITELNLPQAQHPDAEDDDNGSETQA